MTTPERSEEGHVDTVADTSTSTYDLVQEYFLNTGVECWECPHFASWTEPHGERLSDCKLLVEGKSDACPALDTLIEKAKSLTEPE